MSTSNSDSGLLNHSKSQRRWAKLDLNFLSKCNLDLVLLNHNIKKPSLIIVFGLNLITMANTHQFDKQASPRQKGTGHTCIDIQSQLSSDTRFLYSGVNPRQKGTGHTCIDIQSQLSSDTRFLYSGVNPRQKGTGHTCIDIQSQLSSDTRFLYSGVNP